MTTTTNSTTHIESEVVTVLSQHLEVLTALLADQAPSATIEARTDALFEVTCYGDAALVRFLLTRHPAAGRLVDDV